MTVFIYDLSVWCTNSRVYIVLVSKIQTFLVQLPLYMPVNETSAKPYYLVMYRWANKDQGPNDFILPKHGNATRPTTSSYYRNDPTLFHEVDELLDKGIPLTRCIVT